MKKLEDVNGMSETTNSNQIRDEKKGNFICTREVFCFYDIDFIIDLMEMNPNDKKFIQDAKILIDQLTSKIVNNDQNHYFYGMRSFFYERMGMIDESKADFDKALSLNACEAYCQRGYFICPSKGPDLNEAVKYFSEAIKLNENLIDAYFFRAETYSVLEEYELAIDDYSKIIELKEWIVDAYFARGTNFQALAFKHLTSKNTKKGLSFLVQALNDFNNILLLGPTRVEIYLETLNNRNSILQQLNIRQIEMVNHLARITI